MAGEVTVESAVYKLIGDGSSYDRMMKDAAKNTEDLSKKTKSLEGTLGDLDKFGKGAGWWKDSAKVGEYKDEVKGLAKELTSLTEVFKDTPDKEKGVLGSLNMLGDVATTVQSSWTKASSVLTTTSGLVTGLATSFKGLTVSIASSATAAGTLSIALKAIPFVAVAAAIATVVYQVYSHLTAMEKLNKELEKGTEKAEAWAAAYRGASSVIITQSQIIPDAAGKIKFLGDEWSKAEKEYAKIQKDIKGLEVRKGGITQFAADTMFGAIDTHGGILSSGLDYLLGTSGGKDKKKEIDDFGDEVEVVTEKVGLLGKAFAFARFGYQGFANKVLGILPESESSKRAGVELEDAIKKRQAVNTRLEEFSKEVLDSSGKIQTSIRQALAKEQFDVMTIGKTPYEKQVFAFEEQMKFLKAASDLMENTGDWDKADDIWKSYKSLEVLFQAFKDISSEGAIKQAEQNIKDFAKELKDSIKIVDLAGDKLKRFRIEEAIMQAGGIPSKTQLDRLDEVIKKKEEAFANKKLMDEGKALNRQFMDEEKKFIDEQVHLEELLERGAITENTYWKALDALEIKYGNVEDAANYLSGAIRGIDASVAGSSDHIAKMIAQMDSLTFRPEIAAPWGKKIYYPAGPEEDAFEKRYRSMGPRRERADYFDPEIDTANAAARLALKEELQAKANFVGPTQPERSLAQILLAGFNAVVAAIKANPGVNIEEADFHNDDSIFS